MRQSYEDDFLKDDPETFSFSATDVRFCQASIVKDDIAGIVDFINENIWWAILYKTCLAKQQNLFFLT